MARLADRMMIDPDAEAASAILERLVDVSRRIEEYRTAIAHLEIERSELQWQLRASGWKPPQAADA